MTFDKSLAAYAEFAVLTVVVAFLVFSISRYIAIFYREARGQRKLMTLAGAAAGIAIIVSIIVGVLSEPLPTFTAPPKANKAPALP